MKTVRFLRSLMAILKKWILVRYRVFTSEDGKMGLHLPTTNKKILVYMFQAEVGCLGPHLIDSRLQPSPTQAKSGKESD